MTKALPLSFLFRVDKVIRISLKAVYFGAFRPFFFDEHFNTEWAKIRL